MAGYSGKPLVAKLGIKAGFTLYVHNPPPNYLELVSPLPPDVKISTALTSELDMIHLFARSRAELAARVEDCVAHIRQDGQIWISWPKKASRVPTDVTEDVIREIILPLGLVDVKVCAVDAVWSGLKVVIRKENRV